MSDNQIWLIGAVICFCLCFRSVYKHRKENTDEENTLRLGIVFVISLLSWVGIVLVICLGLLVKKGE